MEKTTMLYSSQRILVIVSGCIPHQGKLKLLKILKLALQQRGQGKVDFDLSRTLLQNDIREVENSF